MSGDAYLVGERPYKNIILLDYLRIFKLLLYNLHLRCFTSVAYV